jgi:hypothetical protein
VASHGDLKSRLQLVIVRLKLNRRFEEKKSYQAHLSNSVGSWSDRLLRRRGVERMKLVFMELWLRLHKVLLYFFDNTASQSFSRWTALRQGFLCSSIEQSSFLHWRTRGTTSFGVMDWITRILQSRRRENVTWSKDCARSWGCRPGRHPPAPGECVSVRQAPPPGACLTGALPPDLRPFFFRQNRQLHP